MYTELMYKLMYTELMYKLMYTELMYKLMYTELMYKLTLFAKVLKRSDLSLRSFSLSSCALACLNSARCLASVGDLEKYQNKNHYMVKHWNMSENLKY